MAGMVWHYTVLLVSLSAVLYVCDGTEDEDSESNTIGGQGQLRMSTCHNGRYRKCQTKPRIYSLHIQSDIKMRFATTLVTSRVANNANVSRDVVFDVTLPKEAFISNFTMNIEGEIYVGEVQRKQDARVKFETAKKRGESAAHVSQRPRDTNVFKIEVNIAAFSKVTFNLTYQEFLQRTLGVYKHKVFVNPGQPVDDFRIDASIQESRDIRVLRVPPISDHLLTNDYMQENTIAVITRPSSSSALIQYHPTVEQQSEQSGDSPNGLAGQFVVEYDIERAMDAGDLLVVNGYFVHLFAPEVPVRLQKDILFILDESGSMYGRKIEQLKDAMYTILDDLQEGDRFSIRPFSHHTKRAFSERLVDASYDSIKQATAFVENHMSASGGTNINRALLDGIELLNLEADESPDTGRSQVIMFLTDGMATSGEIETVSILRNVKKKNTRGIPIFSLAFGSDADWDLVRLVAFESDGVARKIYADSDADLQVTYLSSD